MSKTFTPFAGVIAAQLTPLDRDLAPDIDRMAAHGKWLLESGCDSLSPLGTTGEANSFTVGERIAVMEGLVERGLEPARLMAGTGCCAVPDTVTLTRRAVDLGYGGVLMLPPFYYKNPEDDGLFAAYAQVIEAVGDAALKIYAYHFPQMSNMPLSEALIGRLVAAYPDTVVGLKDSSGDLKNMIRMVRAFPGFAVLSGSDHLLLELLDIGGAGCITAVSNVAPDLAQGVYSAWRGGTNATDAQVRLTAVMAAISRHPYSAGLKEILARHTGDDGWMRLRPPLTRLDGAARADLLAGFDATGFSIQPLP